MSFSLQFLGTSGGMPSSMRNVTSLILRHQNQGFWVMIDCGEATQIQLMRSAASAAKIGYILITHLHGDHVLGLPGLISSRALQGVETPLEICGPAGLIDYLRASLLSSRLREWPLKTDQTPLPSGLIQAKEFDVGYPLRVYEIKPEPGQWLLGQQLGVQWQPLHHGIASLAYRVSEVESRRSFLVEKAQAAGIPSGPIYRQLAKGETVTLEDGRQVDGNEFLGPAQPPLALVVGGDNAEPELLAPLLAGASLVVHEATFLQRDFDKLPKQQLHSTAELLAETAQRHGVPNLVMTHFSPRYHLQLARREEDQWRKAAKQYQGNLILADDLLKLELSREGLKRGF